jgi:hypothetical protein
MASNVLKMPYATLVMVSIENNKRELADIRQFIHTERSIPISTHLSCHQMIKQYL